LSVQPGHRVGRKMANFQLFFFQSGRAKDLSALLYKHLTCFYVQWRATRFKVPNYDFRLHKISICDPWHKTRSYETRVLRSEALEMRGTNWTGIKFGHQLLQKTKQWRSDRPHLEITDHSRDVTAPSNCPARVASSRKTELDFALLWITNSERSYFASRAAIGWRGIEERGFHICYAGALSSPFETS